ncbi:MAG: heme ABC transporter permease [Proteobacteria bacterium]|nr:MAG: heme ABC transporter permease [Pseudomonadota bacterium]
MGYKWTFFHKLGSPRWFYEISGKWLPWLAVISAVLLVLGTIWGLLYAPADFRQGNSYRIIFIHVPSAFLAQSVFFSMAVAGGISLIWRMKIADMFLKAAAPIGATFTFLALVTGAVWAKPTWGTWWVWDARLTSMLILLFLYFGVIALQAAIDDLNVSDKACAVLSLVGVVNIPVIKYSVEWWNTLHQPASLKLTEKSNMHPDMLIPLLIMIAGFYVFFGVTAILRTRNEILERERRTRWVKALFDKQ